MKFKNIPTDIKIKSIEEAKQEVFEILKILEKEEKLDDLLDKYNRLMHLNNYIEQKFKDKLRQISQSNINSKQKIF